MLRNVKPLLAVLAFVAFPAVAHAEEPTKSYPDCGREPTDAEVAAAKGAFQAGNASFNEADYARAIDYWEDAYRRDCTANPLLLNLARAYELAGRKRQAVVSLETFLTREPTSGEKEQINRRIEVLKKKIAEEDAAAAAAPPPPTTTTGALSPAVAGQPARPDAEPEHDERAKRSPWPWIVMGVGGAVTVVGVIGYAGANKNLNDATDRCGGDRANCMNTQAADDGNKARSDMTASGVIAGVGVAAVAGGVIWWAVDGKRVARANQSASRTRLYPVLGRDQAGLSLSGSF